MRRILDDNDLPCLTSGSTFSNSERPITTYNENGSVRPHLAGASITQNDAAPHLGPRRGLDHASTCSYSPLPLPLPAIASTPPSLATATIHIPFPMCTALPTLRLPTCAHIPLDPHHAHFMCTPHLCLPHPRPRPGPHTVALATVTWQRRRHDDHDRTIAMASS
jgi:hypothetical protein